MNSAALATSGVDFFDGTLEPPSGKLRFDIPPMNLPEIMEGVRVAAMSRSFFELAIKASLSSSSSLKEQNPFRIPVPLTDFQALQKAAEVGADPVIGLKSFVAGFVGASPESPKHFDVKGKTNLGFTIVREEKCEEHKSLDESEEQVSGVLWMLEAFWSPGHRENKWELEGINAGWSWHAVPFDPTISLLWPEGTHMIFG